MTTVDRARSATTALYREPFHVGQHGQAIIADTIAARLRRGAVVVAAADGAAWSPITPAVPAAVPTLLAAAFGPGTVPRGTAGIARDGRTERRRAHPLPGAGRPRLVRTAPRSDPHAARQDARPQALAVENAGTAELNAMIERVAPDVLALLADGVPRSKAAIVEALAGRQAKEDVTLALIRLAVTEQVEETGGRYALGAAEP